MSAHRTPRMLALGAAAISILLSSPPISAAAADPAPSDSTVTVTGTGEFANLKVTVGQTKNLINQAVTVSWTGGHPTLPSSGDFGVNYLQIMQCWGDDQKNGPDRTQCQYGGSSSGSTNNGGSFVRSRQINYGNLVDPKEKLKQATGSFDNAYVPFWAVATDQPTGPATVNELAAPFDITKQAVSKHIQVLEQAGLVTRTRDAQRRPVHLDAAALERLTAWIDRYRLDAERSYRRLDTLLAAMTDTHKEGTEK